MLKYFAITILFSGLLFASPYWYDSQSYKSEGTVYFGYGEGDTKKEARQNAYEEIAQQLRVSIHSTINIKSTDEKSTTLHEVTVSSGMILKESKIQKRVLEDGRYYVLVQYRHTTPLWFETRDVDAPLFSMLGFGSGITQADAITSAKKDLSAQNYNAEHLKITTLKSEKLGDAYFIAISTIDIPNLKCSHSQNKLIAQSSLIKEANKLTSCDYPYQLKYINNRWHLEYANTYFSLSRKNFDSFFNSINNQAIKLFSKRTLYQEDDGYYLDFTVSQRGHLTLFNIYEDGRVGLIIENRAVKNEDAFSFPSVASKQEFYAAVNVKGKDTKDMFIAILSSEKLNLSQYKKQMAKRVDKNEYLFNEVLALTQAYSFTTLVLRIEAK